MKKENLVFGLLGIVIGIIIGVIVGNQSFSRTTNAEATVPQQTAAQNTGQQQQQLPEGHPPVDNTALLGELKTQLDILQKDPQNLQALMSAANLNYDMKNYKEAISYYEQALKQDPKNINLLTDCGTSYFYAGEPQSALAKYQASLALDPGHMQTLMNIGVVKMSLGDHQGAADSWEKIVTLYPNSPDVPQLKQSIEELRKKK